MELKKLVNKSFGTLYKSFFFRKLFHFIDVDDIDVDVIIWVEKMLTSRFACNLRSTELKTIIIHSPKLDLEANTLDKKKIHNSFFLTNL